MSISYNTATVQGRLQVVINNIDAGAGNGQMRLLGPTAATVALIILAKPSGTIGGQTLLFSGLPLAGTTIISTRIVSADIEDSTGLVVASGLTVGQSTAFDLVMANTTVVGGQILTLTSATITGV